MTGPGILGLMEVLVEFWIFTFFERLICLKYTGKRLDMSSKKSQSYERFNDVAFCENLGELTTHAVTNTSMLKNIHCTYVANY